MHKQTMARAAMAGLGLLLVNPLIAIASEIDAVNAALDLQMQQWKEDALSAPIDTGSGPAARTAARVTTQTYGNNNNNGSSYPSAAVTEGYFGPAFSWPIIPIHVALLPDGRVMNYGTDQFGKQGGSQFIYDVWDPKKGTGSNAHLVLPNTTNTEIFCGAQSLMATTGLVVFAGGSKVVNNVRNYAQSGTEYFNPKTNSMASVSSMRYPRWYGSLIGLPNGELLALGGRQTGPAPEKVIGATTPEIFNQYSGWRSLPGADSATAYAIGANWWYPRAFVAPSGNVVTFGTNGLIYSMNPSGSGSITPVGQALATSTSAFAVMYAPGKVLTLRSLQQPLAVDINPTIPIGVPAGVISQPRLWSSATVMADGKVAVTGGSGVANVLTNVAYRTEIWNPATNQWTMGAAAAKPRLYHSTALLLPDATVLTAGGGAPGPVMNLNAEIYYPPYLFTTGGGDDDRRSNNARSSTQTHDWRNNGGGGGGSVQLATRPSLSVDGQVMSVGQSFQARTGWFDRIRRLTLVRTGSSTHSNNLDQRFFELPFQQGWFGELRAQLPGSANVLVPGYYMLFAFNDAGTPSVAATFNVLASRS